MKTFARLVATIGLALLAMGAAAQTRTVLKLGWATADSPQDSYAIAAHAFKKALEADSKGAIEVQLYPNRQIGDEKQLVEGLRLGTVDTAIITNGAYSPVEPAFQLNDLPFLYANEAQVFQVLDGAVGRQLAALLQILEQRLGRLPCAVDEADDDDGERPFQLQHLHQRLAARRRHLS